MMKKFVIQFFLLIAVIAVALSLFYQNTDFFSLPFVPQKPVVKKLVINNAVLEVEIADNQTKRARGLGERLLLASDAGMLFVFPREDKYPFWMKGLKFPLDFVWIKSDRVTDITENVFPPASGGGDASLPIYEPKENIDKMLEVNAGTVKRLNIQRGDIIKIE